MNQKNPVLFQVLTIPEAAKRFGLSQSTFRYAISDGRIPESEVRRSGPRGMLITAEAARNFAEKTTAR